jgi:hypothetical protein
MERKPQMDTDKHRGNNPSVFICVHLGFPFTCAAWHFGIGMP